MDNKEQPASLGANQETLERAENGEDDGPGNFKTTESTKPKPFLSLDCGFGGKLLSSVRAILSLWLCFSHPDILMNMQITATVLKGRSNRHFLDCMVSNGFLDVRLTEPCGTE